MSFFKHRNSRIENRRSKRALWGNEKKERKKRIVYLCTELKRDKFTESRWDRFSLLKSEWLDFLLAPRTWTLPPRCLHKEAAAGQSATRSYLRHGCSLTCYTPHWPDLQLNNYRCVHRGTTLPGENHTASQMEETHTHTEEKHTTVMIVILHSLGLEKAQMSCLHLPMRNS